MKTRSILLLMLIASVMIKDHALAASKHYLVETKDKNLVDNVRDAKIQNRNLPESSLDAELQNRNLPGAGAGPVMIEDDGKKCKFSCSEDGGCDIKYLNKKTHYRGTVGCFPKSYNGGACSNNRHRAPADCTDCHAARERNNGSPCKEPELPKDEITCDYSCQHGRICMVRVNKVTWTSSRSSRTSWVTVPDYAKDRLPKKCHNQCKKKHPDCKEPEPPKDETTCDYYCDRGSTCMVRYKTVTWTSSGSSRTRNVRTGTVPDYAKDSLPKKCHNQCKKHHPDCSWF